MKKVLEIGGMGCAHCVNGVKEILKELPGVTEVLSVEIGKAVIVINENFDTEYAIKKISEEDYDLISIHGE